jgi:thiosulfate dehydrogenase (quinone) large subunit
LPLIIFKNQYFFSHALPLFSGMKKNLPTYNVPQLFLLVALRIAIGWHLMYEGIVKLLQDNWTAYAFLMDSKGMFSGFFRGLATNPVALSISNQLNMWGLTLIGFALITGIFTRYAKIGGIVLLLFYYLAQPPLMMAEYMLPGEGSYLWVNKNLIELLALAVLYVFPTAHIIGLDRLLKRYY